MRHDRASCAARFWQSVPGSSAAHVLITAQAQWSASRTSFNAASSTHLCKSRVPLDCLHLWSFAWLDFDAQFVAADFAGFLPSCFLCSLLAAASADCSARLTSIWQATHCSVASSLHSLFAAVF